MQHAEGGIDNALRLNLRDLTTSCSEAQFLAKHRQVRNRKGLPDLTDEMICAWVRSHYKRTKRYPTAKSGPIVDAPEETWLGVDMALRHGNRHRIKGPSLAKFLALHFPVRNRHNRPEYNVPIVPIQIPGERPSATRGTS